MVKRVTLSVVISVAIILAAINVYLFTTSTTYSYSSISGMLIDEIPDLPLGLNVSIVAFIIQWIILLLIVIYTYSKFIKHKKAESLRLNFNLVKHKHAKSETDLDILYHLLQEKKVLTIKSIAKLFEITREQAVEWAKILENHGLVTIEYPAFSDPEVRLYEKTEEKPKKESGKTKEEGKKDKKQDKKQNLVKGEEAGKKEGIKANKKPAPEIPVPKAPRKK